MGGVCCCISARVTRTETSAPDRRQPHPLPGHPGKKKGGENHVTDKRIYLYSTPQDDGKMDPLYSHTQARPLFSLTYKNSYSVSVVVVV